MLLQEGYSEQEIIKKLDLPMWCCNRMLFTHMPIIDQLLVRRTIEGRSQSKNAIEASSGGRMDGRGDEGDDGGGDD